MALTPLVGIAMRPLLRSATASMDGIEAARHLGALDEPPAVIFTTAHDEYALAAFETEAVGYLLKPVRREKLARAVRHAARIAGPQLARLAEHSQHHRRSSPMLFISGTLTAARGYPVTALVGA